MLHLSIDASDVFDLLDRSILVLEAFGERLQAVDHDDENDALLACEKPEHVDQTSFIDDDSVWCLSACVWRSSAESSIWLSICACVQSTVPPAKRAVA